MGLRDVSRPDLAERVMEAAKGSEATEPHDELLDALRDAPEQKQ